jgi:hypothetical protein
MELLTILLSIALPMIVGALFGISYTLRDILTELKKRIK